MGGGADSVVAAPLFNRAQARGFLRFQKRKLKACRRYQAATTPCCGHDGQHLEHYVANATCDITSPHLT